MFMEESGVGDGAADLITPYRRAQTRRFLSSGLVALHGMAVALQSAAVAARPRRAEQILEQIESGAQEMITYLDWLLPPDPEPRDTAIRGLHDALNHLRLAMMVIEDTEGADTDALLAQVERAADSGANHADELVQMLQERTSPG